MPHFPLPMPWCPTMVQEPLLLLRRRPPHVRTGPHRHLLLLLRHRWPLRVTICCRGVGASTATSIAQSIGSSSPCAGSTLIHSWRRSGEVRSCPKGAWPSCADASKRGLRRWPPFAVRNRSKWALERSGRYTLDEPKHTHTYSSSSHKGSAHEKKKKGSSSR
jgi:hypothetical protein